MACPNSASGHSRLFVTFPGRIFLLRHPVYLIRTLIARDSGLSAANLSPHMLPSGFLLHITSSKHLTCCLQVTRSPRSHLDVSTPRPPGPSQQPPTPHPSPLQEEAGGGVHHGAGFWSQLCPSVQRTAPLRSSFPHLPQGATGGVGGTCWCGQVVFNPPPIRITWGAFQIPSARATVSKTPQDSVYPRLIITGIDTRD